MPAPADNDRASTLWRCRELLPVINERFAVTLGERRTPLLSLAAAARLAFGLERGELLV